MPPRVAFRSSEGRSLWTFHAVRCSKRRSSQYHSSESILPTDSSSQVSSLVSDIGRFPPRRHLLKEAQKRGGGLIAHATSNSRLLVAVTYDYPHISTSNSLGVCPTPRQQMMKMSLYNTPITDVASFRHAALYLDMSWIGQQLTSNHALAKLAPEEVAMYPLRSVQ